MLNIANYREFCSNTVKQLKVKQTAAAFGLNSLFICHATSIAHNHRAELETRVMGHRVTCTSGQ